jgi:hypothetical protein
MFAAMTDDQLLDFIATAAPTFRAALPFISDSELESFVAGRLTERRVVAIANKRRESGQAPFYPPANRRPKQ